MKNARKYRSGKPRGMRYLLCCEFYAPSVGGVQTVIREIAERLVRSGHDVTVLTSALPQRDFQVLNGVKIKEFPISGNRVRGFKGDISAYQQFILNENADAILIKAAQQWTFDALWPIMEEIKSRKIFIPCGFSGLYRSEYSKYFLEMPAVLRKMNHLIFYAQDYRDTNFARAHGLTHLTVLPNGASETEFSDRTTRGMRERMGLGEETFLFLSVGSLTGMKGHVELLQSYAQLDTKGKETSLILCSNDPFHVLNKKTQGIQLWKPATSWLDKIRTGLFRTSKGRALHALIWREPHDLGKRIRYWDNVIRRQPHKKVFILDPERADVVSLFKESDLFVFASNIEYSPLVLYEAAAAGLPFLTGPAGNAAEIADWTGGGIVYPAAQDREGYTRTDPAVLAQEMDRFIYAKEERQQLGRTGRRRWLKHFTWAKIADSYDDILQGKQARSHFESGN